MPSDPLMLATLAAGLGVAAGVDLRTRRVPNALTGTLAAAGLAAAASGASGLSVTASLAGVGLGVLLMLPGHLLGATGAGDVKLFAASGALLGPGALVTAFLYTALAGGALAVAVAMRRRRLTHSLAGVGRVIATRGACARELQHTGADNRFAYAPAIAAGALLAALST